MNWNNEKHKHETLCLPSNANIPQYFVTLKTLWEENQRLHPKTTVFYGLTKFKPRFLFHFPVYSHCNCSTAGPLETFTSLYFGAQTHPQKPRCHTKAAPKVQHYKYPLMCKSARHIVHSFLSPFSVSAQWKSREQKQQEISTNTLLLPAHRKAGSLKTEQGGAWMPKKQFAIDWPFAWKTEGGTPSVCTGTRYIPENWNSTHAKLHLKS